jgi:dipeptidyl aminopeptidase/acylaminoacyl peptidase
MHLSPDGTALALSVRPQRRASAIGGQRAFIGDGLPRGMVGSRVHVADPASGQVMEPFGPDATSWGAQWSPDGRMLAGYVYRDGPPCLAIWDRDTGEARLFRHAPVRVFFGYELPRWTPDGESVVVKLRAEGDVVEYGERELQSLGPVSGGVRVFSYDPKDEQEPQWSISWTDILGGDLCRVDIATGEIHRLAERWVCASWSVAPDGHAVAALRTVEVDEPGSQTYFDLVVVPLDGGQPRVVARRVPQEYRPCFTWSPDSRRIACLSQERGAPDRLLVVPADGSREPEDLAAGEDIALVQGHNLPLWSADGGSVYSLAPDDIWEFAADGSARRRLGGMPHREIIGWVHRPTGGVLPMLGENDPLALVRDPETRNEGLARIDAAGGEGALLTEFPKTCWDRDFGMDAAVDGSVLYLLLEASDHPPEVWAFGGDFCAARRVVSLNPDLEGVVLSTGRLIEWRALDGKMRRGALLLPPGYAEGHRVPVVFEVYGGGTGSNALHQFGGSDAILSGQLLATRGYAVLYPDMSLEDRDPMRQMPGQVLPAIDRLIDLGIADPERVGLMGQSYGGYCALALLTQTNRFRAAVSVAGMTNLTSLYGIVTDAGYSQMLGWAETDQGRMGGSLWERRDSYIENSPLFYLDRVDTPLLLISGTASRGEAAQAGEAFSALRRLGQRVELRLYEGEDHWPGAWSEASFEDLCERVLGWFDEHLEA